jgi:hypothetical protein
MCIDEFTKDNDQAIVFWISAPRKMVKRNRRLENLLSFIIRMAKLLPEGAEACK